MKRTIFLVICIVLISLACSTVPVTENRPLIGPKTVDVDVDSYQTIYYVHDEKGSDISGDGSKTKPWETIQHALESIENADADHRCAILVSRGDYSKNTIVMKSFVDLYGGFDPETWSRDILKYVSILKGDGKRRIVIASGHARLDGFTLMDGKIRGKGAAVYGKGVSPAITNNVFKNNKTLGPKPWRPKYRHLITNDGGAVYFEYGSSPVIENNLFVDNTTENGRGAALAFHSRCDGRIVNNVFLENVAGLDDPMRSSDGGAVSIFDWSNPLIENNIFLNNKALANNDAGGMFVALWASPVIRKNIFVGNVCTDDAGALFVGGQEHRYDAPLDPLPPKDKFFVTVEENLFIGNSNPSRNSGVTRMTMETRGVFRKNVSAYNTGVYFQRSEILIEDNLILDNFLLVETKEGLDPCEVKNNVIWGNFLVTTEADIHSNSIMDGYEDNSSILPKVIQDGFQIIPQAVHCPLRSKTTKLFLSDSKFTVNELANRVIKVGDKWGVIKANDKNHIEIWGDFSHQVNFTVLPSYRLN